MYLLRHRWKKRMKKHRAKNSTKPSYFQAISAMLNQLAEVFHVGFVLQKQKNSTASMKGSTDASERFSNHGFRIGNILLFIGFILCAPLEKQVMLRNSKKTPSPGVGLLTQIFMCASLKEAKSFECKWESRNVFAKFF